jgi:hypothetical protein
MKYMPLALVLLIAKLKDYSLPRCHVLVKVLIGRIREVTLESFFLSAHLHSTVQTSQQTTLRVISP